MFRSLTKALDLPVRPFGLASLGLAMVRNSKVIVRQSFQGKSLKISGKDRDKMVR